MKALRPGDDPSSSDKRDLANEINNAFLAPMARYAPLSSVPRQHLIQPAQSDIVITVTSNAVFQNLLKLNPKKAHGPDGIPSWLLKENADLLAGPIAAILNCSYRKCTLPPVWKKADVYSSNTERKAHPGYQSSVTPYFTYTYSIETCRRICCNDLCEASSDGIDR